MRFSVFATLVTIIINASATRCAVESIGTTLGSLGPLAAGPLFMALFVIVTSMGGAGLLMSRPQFRTLFGPEFADAWEAAPASWRQRRALFGVVLCGACGELAHLLVFGLLLRSIAKAEIARV